MDSLPSISTSSPANPGDSAGSNSSLPAEKSTNDDMDSESTTSEYDDEENNLSLRHGEVSDDQEGIDLLRREDLVKNREVPPELNDKNILCLECESSSIRGLCNVYVIGTSHVSTESCEEVHALISHLRPEVVFVELCTKRVSILTSNIEQTQTFGEMIEAFKKGRVNFFGLIYSWFSSKVASQLQVFPGAEFRAAYEEGIACGAKVILGDRPIEITLKRTWGMMPTWHKVKMIIQVLFQSISLPDAEELNKLMNGLQDMDMLTFLIKELSESYPTLSETIIHERDLYMSHTLLQVARRHDSVVAVVGKGHLPGIKQHWQQPVELGPLMIIPEKRTSFFTSKLRNHPYATVAAMAATSGCLLASRKTTLGIAVAGLTIASGYLLSRRRS